MPRSLSVPEDLFNGQVELVAFVLLPLPVGWVEDENGRVNFAVEVATLDSLLLHQRLQPAYVVFTEGLFVHSDLKDVQGLQGGGTLEGLRLLAGVVERL